MEKLRELHSTLYLVKGALSLKNLYSINHIALYGATSLDSVYVRPIRLWLWIKYSPRSQYSHLIWWSKQFPSKKTANVSFPFFLHDIPNLPFVWEYSSWKFSHKNELWHPCLHSTDISLTRKTSTTSSTLDKCDFYKYKLIFWPTS